MVHNFYTQFYVDIGISRLVRNLPYFYFHPSLVYGGNKISRCYVDVKYNNCTRIETCMCLILNKWKLDHDKMSKIFIELKHAW